MANPLNIDASPAQMETALAAFRQTYPNFDQTHALDDLRASDYARLERVSVGRLPDV